MSGNPLKQRGQPHPKELSQLKGKGVFFPLRVHDTFYNTIPDELTIELNFKILSGSKNYNRYKSESRSN